MATPAIIAVTPGSGINLDAVSLTVGLNTVVRETMVIADPSNATYLATVNSSGALNVSDSVIEACITANVLAVSLPTAQITTLTPPSASSIASAIVANPPTVGISASQTIAVTNTGTFLVQAELEGHGGVALDAVLGATKPANVLQVGGNDGTNAYAIPLASGGTSVIVSGSFYQTTQPVSIASGQVASGAFASGSIASGAVASGAIASGAFAAGSISSGAIASGAVASGAITSGAAVSGAFADGSLVTLGVKADAKSTATDTTPITVMQVLKEISYMAQNPANTPTTPAIPTVAATVRTNGTTSSSGWTSIVAAGGGSTTVRLMRLMVSASAATNIEIGDGSTVFLGPYYLTANGSIVLDISGEPWCVTGANGALEINNSNAVAITYTTWTTQS